MLSFQPVKINFLPDEIRSLYLIFSLYKPDFTPLKIRKNRLEFLRFLPQNHLLKTYKTMPSNCILHCRHQTPLVVLWFLNTNVQHYTALPQLVFIGSRRSRFQGDSEADYTGWIQYYSRHSGAVNASPELIRGVVPGGFFIGFWQMQVCFVPVGLIVILMHDYISVQGSKRYERCLWQDLRTEFFFLRLQCMARSRLLSGRPLTKTG